MANPTAVNTQLWDQFVLKHPRAHFLQLSAWGTLKSQFGWTVDYALLQNDEAITAGAQILFRPLPTKLGTMAYLPYGPLLTDESQWPELLKAIRQCAKKQQAAFLKMEAGHYLDGNMPDFAALGFRESPQTIQPPNTILIDITGADDAIQKRMNQGTRRNIRKAYKNDVRYFHATPDEFELFARITDITGERNAFGTRSAEYNQTLYDLFVPDHATLILAEHEGDPLAANLLFTVGKTAVYLEGASSNHKRNLMASYGVQWEGIQWAKEHGCTHYDMWGIPDVDEDSLEEQFQERNDGLWGVYRFKRGWGGDITRSAGTWDFVYNPVIYAAYRAVLNWRS